MTFKETEKIFNGNTRMLMVSFNDGFVIARNFDTYDEFDSWVDSTAKNRMTSFCSAEVLL